jgi:hypothetical protein
VIRVEPEVGVDSTPEVQAKNASDWISTIFTLVLFGGFGLCFAALGVYAMVQSYPKQGWVAIVGGSVFICFGLGLAALVISACISHGRDLNRAAADPDHPWRSSGQWNSSDISDHALGGAIGAWIIAILFNAVTAASLWSAVLGRQRASPAALLVVLFFLAIGLYLLMNGVRASARAMRYGKSTLHLTTMPAEIGGHLTGEIRLQRPIDAIGPARLRLACKRTSRGEHASTSTDWQNVSEIEHLPDTNGGTVIPVDFQIPATLPPTRSSTSTLDRIRWSLETTVAARGVNYRSSFDVPVFDVRGVGAKSASDFPSFPPPESNFASTDHAGEPPTHPGIVLARLAGGGCSIHFAAGRNWVSTLIWTAIGAGLTWGLLYAQSVHADWMLRFWLIIFAIPFDLAALSGWLSSSTVTARPSGLHVERGWPLLRKHEDLAAASITDITDQISTTVGNTSYYRLTAKSHKGDDISLASGIRERAVARWAAAELLQSLGKTSRPVAARGHHK